MTYFNFAFTSLEQPFMLLSPKTTPCSMGK